MSRYKAYPSYKETRHSWLESVPAHWKMLPLKFLTAQHVTDGPHETPEFIDEGVPFLSVDGIQNNQLVFEGCRYISREDHARYSIKCKPKQGDVLLGKAASVGKVAHVDTDIEFNVWSPLAVIRPRSKKTGRFIYYSLQSALLQMQCDMYSNANTQKNLGMSTIDNLAFASPTDDEAEQIAHFLDHETAKIDALIEKQQRLIELLKEKRQAVISHAVTKGLNPNAPMKDSGVEWLGEVPAHWEVMRLKHLATNIKAGPFGSAITKDMYVSAGYRVYGQEQVIPEDFSIGDYYVSSETFLSLNQYKVTAGDILISCVGTFGKIAVVPPSIEPGIINPRLIRFQCNEHITPSLLAIVLRSAVVFEQFAYLSRGGTMDVINIGTLSEINVVIPPLNEQDELVAHVTTKSIRFDALIGKAESAISLLQERRTALISAAVTGKIDVRDWQAAT